ncbi:hypothetical protein E2C01_060768 [Portunus trituberculatus]|uniref:Uncharacterized protein n=1 Tax=Portunus trituberculatus TaxID=210409 RepID=A0A5B7HCE0_PORTR|nr:hypothetical protein [Portunus trituberculatus]
MKKEKANIAYERQPGISRSYGKNVNKAAVGDTTHRHGTSETTLRFSMNSRSKAVWHIEGSCLASCLR